MKQKINPGYISRRKFIGQASCLGVGYATLFSSLINLKALNAAAMAHSLVADDEDYKALVCFFQAGGNDSYNLLIPANPDEYSQYAVTRSNLAIPANELLGIQPVNIPGRAFGLHPAVPQLRQLFDQGHLSFITNIGTLVEPVTLEQIQAKNVRLPLGLFSHADQSQQWQTAYPHVRTIKGWGGKIADLINDMNTNQAISMNISLSGTNLFQNGNLHTEFSLDPYNGATGIMGYGEQSWNQIREMQTRAIDHMLDKDYLDVFKRSYVDVIRVSRDASIQVSEALENSGGLNASFSDNTVSKSFEMVARMMKAREDLGFRRQIFFIEYSGWDHHDELLNNQSEMLGVVSRAFGEFHTALQELDLLDQVTTFSISEFARTLTSNGNGTDHAWGGNVMVMGGNQINGGRIFGNYPDLALGNNGMLWDGVMIPTLSADTYFAELAKWFGVAPSDLTSIFPNLGNFYNVNSPEFPIGFLKAG